MNPKRLGSCLLLLLLSPLLTAADPHQEAASFCREQAATGNSDCHIQLCPCQELEITLSRFPRSNGEGAICACSHGQTSLSQLRHKASDACLQHRGQSCFVSRGDCPTGFEAIATFKNTMGHGFTACTDQRHTRTPGERLSGYGQHSVTADDLMQQYRQLTRALKEKAQGESKSLPRQSRDQLNRHFRGLSLHRLRFTQSQALANGCFSDCEQIYCAEASTIDRWTNNSNPIISDQLLHQIAHAESCVQHGGRERFMSRWYHFLPVEIHQQLSRDEPVDTTKIHFAIFMENKIKHRAESLCRLLNNCRMD